MGDFNINILNSQSHQPSNEFINLMVSNSLYPLISKPTRLTSWQLQLWLIIYLQTISNTVWIVAFSTLIYLIISQFSKSFRSKLVTIDWSVIYDSDSTNDSYNTFSSLLISAYHKSFPLKPVYPESGRSSKPWFSKGLFVSCNRKNSLYKQFQTNPTESNKSRYNKSLLV